MTAFGGALNDPTKVIASRVGAYIVDIILMSALFIGVFAVLALPMFEEVDVGPLGYGQDACDAFVGPAGSYQRQQTDDICFSAGNTAYVAAGDDASAVYSISIIAFLVIGGFNQVLMPAMYGASAGKFLFGLRVVTADGRKAGFFRNLARWLLLIVDALCCYCLPGIVVASNSKGHRRIGDMAAGTFVIHRSAYGRLLHIPGFLVVRGREERDRWAADPNVHGSPLGQGGGVDAPVWDPQRNAYIRYDATTGLWHRWDDATQQWLPVQ